MNKKEISFEDGRICRIWIGNRDALPEIGDGRYAFGDRDEALAVFGSLQKQNAELDVELEKPVTYASELSQLRMF